jgi:acyl carrier protein
MSGEAAMDASFLAAVSDKAKHLPPGEPIDVDTALSSLGVDSMAAVNLLLELEELFDIVMPDDLLTEETFATARTLWAAITSVREGPPAA